MSKFVKIEDLESVAQNHKKRFYLEYMLCGAETIEFNEGKWAGEADGYWNGELIYDVWYCPFCDHRIEEDDEDLLPNYCPNCGAKMKG